jgi:chromosome segregation ATPase
MNRIHLLTESFVMDIKGQEKSHKSARREGAEINPRGSGQQERPRKRRTGESSEVAPEFEATGAREVLEKDRRAVAVDSTKMKERAAEARRLLSERRDQKAVAVDSIRMITVLRGYKEQVDTLSAANRTQQKVISEIGDQNLALTSAVKELRAEQVSQTSVINSVRAELEATRGELSKSQEKTAALNVMSEDLNKQLTEFSGEIETQKLSISELSEALQTAMGALEDCMKPKYLQEALRQAHERGDEEYVASGDLKEIISSLKRKGDQSVLDAWLALITEFEWADPVMLGDLVASFGTADQKKEIGEILAEKN